MSQEKQKSLLPWLLLITVLALVVRAINLGAPAEEYFDEVYYVKGAEDLINGRADSNSVHPPLGKWIIAVGRMAGEAIGMSPPVSWRLSALVLGVAMIPLTMLLASRLTRGNRTAILLSGALLSIDFLHLVQSRIAMLDIFLAFFVLLGILATLKYVHCRSIDWAVWAALAFGVATAVKWSGLFAAAGAVMSCYFFEKCQVAQPKRGVPPDTIKLALACAVVIPVVYVGSYFHHWRLEGVSPEAVVSIRKQQKRMINFRYDAEQFKHRYTSQFWEWPLVARPVWYLYEEDEGTVEGIVCFGSILFWWAALVLLFEAGADGWKHRSGPQLFLVSNYVGNWIFWIISTTGGFFYYMVVNVPFMAVIVGWRLSEWLQMQDMRRYAQAYLALLLLAFLLNYPLLVGLPIPEGYFRALFPFSQWI